MNSVFVCNYYYYEFHPELIQPLKKLSLVIQFTSVLIALLYGTIIQIDKVTRIAIVTFLRYKIQVWKAIFQTMLLSNTLSSVFSDACFFGISSKNECVHNSLMAESASKY